MTTILIGVCPNCANVHLVLRDEEDGEEVGQVALTPNAADEMADDLRGAAEHARKLAEISPAKGTA